jgi:hypothetical protein
MSGQTPLLFAFTILVIVAAIALNNGLEQLTTMHPIFSSLVTSPSATIAKWEADGVYTRQEEGPWAGKSGKHAPNLAVRDGGWGMVEVEVLHPDEPDHHTEGKVYLSGANNTRRDPPANLLSAPYHSRSLLLRSKEFGSA